MYQYIWDPDTNGLLLTTGQSKFSKEPRPVYYQELDILGFDKYWTYPKEDIAPLLWAEANNYYYKGRNVAKTKGGSLYTKPEILLLEDPEPEGIPLQFVDVEAMCWKNQDLMETLVQETIQRIYNTYSDYRNKIDVFYVAFSGGKDSVVTLDLVQRTLPHDDFKVLFGDTGMEFSDTYETVKLVHTWCNENGIDFQTSKSEYDPIDTWAKFGPPCTVTRWCCSVHKTSPQILHLRRILNKPDFTGMAFVGVRADESLARSKYEFITYGGKHKGQYSCNAILDWNSAEIFLYIFAANLVLNEAYKKGNRRAGCLICPRAAERNDFMNHYCYADAAEKLVDCIRMAYKNTYSSKERLEEFIENGGWKARKNGRDLDISVGYWESTDKTHTTNIKVENPRTDWREWIKTIGILSNDASPYIINYKGELLKFDVLEKDKEITVNVDSATGKQNPEFVKVLKSVFRKSACCVACKECQANCPYGNLFFEDGKVVIGENCNHCAQCHNVEKGCLVYKSLEKPKGGIIMAGKNMSLNSYSHHAPKMDWIRQYFNLKNDFECNHTLGSQMFSFFKRFLRDAELLNENGFSYTAEIIDKLGYESFVSWGIIFVNLCYSPQINWYVNTIGFGDYYTKQQLASLMLEAGAKESWTNDIFSSLGRLMDLPLGQIGLGQIDKTDKRNPIVKRTVWYDPSPEVIMYSLYRFAEACGGYYQFTLETLLDDSIERDGVSPSRIFGINKDTMVRILNGLSINYPDYISASFTLDLDNITLREDKKSADILAML